MNTAEKYVAGLIAITAVFAVCWGKETERKTGILAHGGLNVDWGKK